MKTIDKVAKLVDKGKSNTDIAIHLGIPLSSVPAYKAHITRRKQTENSYEKLGSYMHSTYIIIPTERVVERLEPGQVPEFVSILETLLGENSDDGGLEGTVNPGFKSSNKSNNKLKPLPESEVREIILEYKKKGLSYNDIRKDPKLENVPWTSIRAYLAHYGRGTYSKERN